MSTTYSDMTVTGNLQAENLTVWDLTVESGQSIKLAGATFENEGTFTSVDTDFGIHEDNEPTAFLGVYGHNNSVWTHANIIMEAGVEGSESIVNLVKNSDIHPYSPNSFGIINDGNIGNFIPEGNQVSDWTFSNFTKDEHGNIEWLNLSKNMRILNETGLWINGTVTADSFIGSGLNISNYLTAERIYLQDSGSDYMGWSSGDSVFEFTSGLDIGGTLFASDINGYDWTGATIDATDEVMTPIIYNTDGDTLEVQDNLEVDGNVGIGKSSEAYPLEISSTAAAILLENSRTIMGMGYNVGALLFSAGESTHEKVGEIAVYATEAWNDTSSPTRMEFYTTPVGSTHADKRMYIDETGDVNFEYNIDVSNRVTSNNINTTEISNTLGDLKIQPDVQGDVELFGDTDVGDGENGKILYIRRQAPEGNDYLRFYVSSGRVAYIHANNKLTLQAQQPFTINSVTDSIYFKVGDNAGAEKVYFRDSDGEDLITIDSNGKLSIDANMGGSLNVYRGSNNNINTVLDSTYTDIRFGGAKDYNRIGTWIDKPFQIVTDSTERITIDSDGKVGIGMTSPEKKLHVDGGNMMVSHTSNPSVIINNTAGKSTAFAAGTNAASILYDNSGSFSIQARNESNVLSGTPNIADAVMVIDSGGNVGIGTTEPDYKLDVRDSSETQLSVFDTSDMAQGVGGGISFYGMSGPTLETEGGRIGIEKTNSDNGDQGYDFIIKSRPWASSAPVEQLKLSSEGWATIANITMEGDSLGNHYFGSSLPSSMGTAVGNNVFGVGSLQSLTDGESNTIIGDNSGDGITDGFSNIIIGSGSGNDLVGSSSDIDTNNIIIGYNLETITGLNTNTINIGNKIWGGFGVVRIGGGQGTALSTGSMLEVVGEVKITDTVTGGNAGTHICIDANNELCKCGSCA